MTDRQTDRHTADPGHDTRHTHTHSVTDRQTDRHTADPGHDTGHTHTHSVTDRQTDTRSASVVDYLLLGQLVWST